MEIEEHNDGARLTLRIVCPGLRPDEISIVVDGARVRVPGVLGSGGAVAIPVQGT